MILPLRPTPPKGQSMLELVLVLGAVAAMLMMVLMVGVVGDLGIRTSLAARFSAFDCDARPDACGQSASPTEAKLRSTVILSDRRDVLASDQAPLKTMKTLGANAEVLQRASDIRLSIDLPRVDGADKNLLTKLADAFRGFGMKAGPLIFDLPSPDQLTRSTVRTALWGSRGTGSGYPQMPTIQLTSRVAMISDTWAASDRTDASRRIGLGESPASVVHTALDALYIPGKDLLMPVLDAIGLESGTGAFRGAFHRVDHDTAYANSRVRIR